MKLLFDQNISHRIIARINMEFAEATHVREVGLRDATDRVIWEYAKEFDYTIVTKDDDFEKFHLVWGAPPKVVWLKIGNSQTDEIARILVQQKDRIQHFITKDLEIGLLEIYPLTIIL